MIVLLLILCAHRIDKLTVETNRLDAQLMDVIIKCKMRDYMGDSTVLPKNRDVQNKLLFFFAKMIFSPKTIFSITETIYERDKKR